MGDNKKKIFQPVYWSTVKNTFFDIYFDLFEVKSASMCKMFIYCEYTLLTVIEKKSDT